jgi:hypothetical protein
MLRQEALVLDIAELDRKQIMEKFEYLQNHREEKITDLKEAVVIVKSCSQVKST